MYKLADYNYILPENRIAQEPTHPADMAKLLLYTDRKITDHRFVDLPDLLDAQSVIFFNDTKVMQSRLLLQNKKCILKTWRETIIATGEIFVYKIHDDSHFEALVSDGKHYRPWSIIFWNDSITLYSESFTQEGILFRIEAIHADTFLQQYGQMPLPPYIQYADNKAQWYQTCFATYIGSAAAPTASLHFTPKLLQSLTATWCDLQYATLHVGLATFKPVYHQDIRQHDIHMEWAMIDITIFTKIAYYKENNRTIVAVGTTMLRLLESLPYLRVQLKAKNWKQKILDTKVVKYWDSLIVDLAKNDYIQDLHIKDEKIFFQTKIFIYPWFTFHIVNRLITNFHLPKTSLLMLLAACIGDDWRVLYDHAIQYDYRFYSFGDGMMVNIQ
jgi:S-adenosylmethionine:tRNA ribosyltransferase-isomerase